MSRRRLGDEALTIVLNLSPDVATTPAAVSSLDGAVLLSTIDGAPGGPVPRHLRANEGLVIAHRLEGDIDASFRLADLVR
jgi:hypothetical protein